MALDLVTFRRQFPKYALFGIACVNGRVCEERVSSHIQIGKSADPLYFDLYRDLRVGMTIEQCFDVWIDLLSAEPGFNNWDHFHNWEPDPNEWWYNDKLMRLCIKDGVVAKYTGYYGSPLRCSDPGMREAFKGMPLGLPLHEVQQLLMLNSRGGKRWQGLYNFEPRIAPQSYHEGRIKATTPGGSYNRSKCPELLSTTNVDVRLLYPNGSNTGTPDQVQVVLYALTKVWQDSSRTKVNPRVKALVPIYFEFAQKQVVTDKRVRQQGLKERLAPKCLRVTKDCCIEVDFDVKKE